MKWWVAMLVAGLALTAVADEAIRLCYNWSCAREHTAAFPEPFLSEIGNLVLDADSPAHERELVAVAVARMYGWAAERTPIGADRAGNTADAEADGRMDCIDHSTNTTAILRLFEARGWLHFHRVAEPEIRTRFVFAAHRSAVIEEMPPGLGVGGGDSNDQFVGARFVIDSWFVDPGAAAVVLPLNEWLKGGGPDVK